MLIERTTPPPLELVTMVNTHQHKQLYTILSKPQSQPHPPPHGAMTLSIMTFSITTLSITIKMRQSTMTLHNCIEYCNAECVIIYCYAECHYAKCRYAECRGATHHNHTHHNGTQHNNKNETQHNDFEYRYAECHIFIVMLSVVMLNVVMLSVVAPLPTPTNTLEAQGHGVQLDHESHFKEIKKFTERFIK
jgi:hypothetical protein